ncbi:sterol desaturase family protein [Aurantivibrio infirmus]
MGLRVTSTIFLHSNFTLRPKNFLGKQLSFYPNYHSAHHLSGKVNFGFVASLWDRLFKTTL